MAPENTPPHRGSLEILGGGGVVGLKSQKLLKESMKSTGIFGYVLEQQILGLVDVTEHVRLYL